MIKIKIAKRVSNDWVEIYNEENNIIKSIVGFPLYGDPNDKDAISCDVCSILVMSLLKVLFSSLDNPHDQMLLEQFLRKIKQD